MVARSRPVTAFITNIQRFSLNDGPGIRTTVFLQGCNMNCAWCHNPEMIDMHPVLMFYENKCVGCGTCFKVCPTGAHQVVDGKHIIDRTVCTSCGTCAESCFADALMMSSRQFSVAEVMAEIRQDKLYYDRSGGGVTVSGGEATLQGAFIEQLADACHAEGIEIAVETNASLPYDRLERMLSKMDLIMCDLKLVDSRLHKRFTGIENHMIFNTVGRMSTLGIPLIVRTPLIPGATDSIENLQAIVAYLAKLQNIRCYELLNYNPLGSSKRIAIDEQDPFGQCKPFSTEQLDELKHRLAESGVCIKVS